MTAHCVQAANARLGESPSWDHIHGVLYWVDGERPAVFRWDPFKGQTGHWPMPHLVGCVSPAKEGRLIFADAEGLGYLDLDTGDIARIGNPQSETDRLQNLFNDGKVDRAGRLWVGSIDRQSARPTGSLYRLDPDLSTHRLDSGFICSNGMGWSPDDRTMYFTDSLVRTIWAYDFDSSTGKLADRRVFAKLSDDDGLPDGLTVDSDGFVWSAIWDGWRVIRYTPDGVIDQELRLPVQRPTSCTFGGPDLQTLYVTSASTELAGHVLKKGPLAGALFSVRTEVAGLPTVPFGT